MYLRERERERVRTLRKGRQRVTERILRKKEISFKKKRVGRWQEETKNLETTLRKKEKYLAEGQICETGDRHSQRVRTLRKKVVKKFREVYEK